MAIEVGSKIGEYELTALLGRGGQASVYKAWQPSLKRYVAIKVLAESMADDPQFSKRFEREAQANARLRHPNIVGVHTVGEVEHRPYIVMDYLEGQSMRDWLRARRFTLNEFLPILRQVASALDYAHSRSLVHRDVKPANVMLVDNNRQAILTDFGIAKALDEAAGNLTGTGMSIGTPIYMSPEQGMAEESVSPTSDIYSLGIIAYEALAGRTPFEGGSAWSVLNRHANETPPLISNFNPAVPPLAEEVIRKALAKRPADRYQTATQFADELAVALGHSTPTALNPTQLSVAVRDPQTVPLANTPPGGFSTNIARPPTPPGGFRPTSPMPPDAGPTNVLPDYPPVQPARKGNATLAFVVGGLVIAMAVIAIVVFVVLNGQNNTPVSNTVNRGAATATALAQSVETANAQSANLQATITAGAQAGVGGNPTQAAIQTQLAQSNATITALAQPTPTNSAPGTTEAPATTAAPANNSPVPPTASGNTAYKFNIDRNAISAAVDAIPGKSSVLIIDPNWETLKDDDSRQQMPAASIIKLWIAAAVYQDAKDGNLNLNDKYTVKNEDKVTGTGILQNNVGKSYTYQQIVDTMLQTSDNVGANILLNRLGGGDYQRGFDKVNAFASNNDFTRTKMQRRLGGEFIDVKKDNLTSASDCVFFFQQMLLGFIVDGTSSTKILNALDSRSQYQADQNFFNTNLPPGTPFIHISGTGTNAANEVGYFEIENRQILVAFLTAGNGDQAASQKQVAAAIGKIFNAIKPA